MIEKRSRWRAMSMTVRWSCAATVILVLAQSPVASGSAAGAPAAGSPPRASALASPIPSGLHFRAHPKTLSPLPPPPPGSPPPDPAPRDFAGIWLAPSMRRGPAFGSAPPRYTPQALKKAQYAAKMNAEGKPLATNAAHCRPMDDITVGWDLFPAEIIQTEKEVVVLEEEGRGRWQIYLDRGHPKHLVPSFWGDSVGHWEGNTLVVDTIGFSGEEDGTTPTTHIISRLRKIDGGREMVMKVTTIDPAQYLQPFTQTRTSYWHPGLRLLEFQCEENPSGAMEGLTAK